MATIDLRFGGTTLPAGEIGLVGTHARAPQAGAQRG